MGNHVISQAQIVWSVYLDGILSLLGVSSTLGEVFLHQTLIPKAEFKEKVSGEFGLHVGLKTNTIQPLDLDPGPWTFCFALLEIVREKMDLQFSIKFVNQCLSYWPRY